MYPRIGVAEVLLSCLIGLIGVGLPVSMLVLLFMIYNKLKSIEESLKKE
jgi:hypothetical protein